MRGVFKNEQFSRQIRKGDSFAGSRKSRAKTRWERTGFVLGTSSSLK